MATQHKPQALKALSGTIQPCRVPPEGLFIDPILVVPDCPPWVIGNYAVDFWRSVAPILVANKMLTPLSITPLAHLCVIHHEIVMMYMRRETPAASMIGVMTALINDFGMTPLSQGKIKPISATPEKVNKFAARGKKPDA